MRKGIGPFPPFELHDSTCDVLYHITLENENLGMDLKEKTVYIH
jgi:hypothetical protein